MPVLQLGHELELECRADAALVHARCEGRASPVACCGSLASPRVPAVPHGRGRQREPARAGAAALPAAGRPGERDGVRRAGLEAVAGGAVLVLAGTLPARRDRDRSLSEGDEGWGRS